MDFKPPDAPAPFNLTQKAKQLSEKVLILRSELRESI